MLIRGGGDEGGGSDGSGGCSGDSGSIDGCVRAASVRSDEASLKARFGVGFGIIKSMAVGVDALYPDRAAAIVKADAAQST